MACELFSLACIKDAARQALELCLALTTVLRICCHNLACRYMQGIGGVLPYICIMDTIITNLLLGDALVCGGCVEHVTRGCR